MKNLQQLTATFFLMLAGTFAPAAFANDHMSETQAEVWAVVAESWEDETKETGAWPSEYVHKDAHGWDAAWPVPRGVESLSKWSRFGAESGESLIYELFPMNVTVSGDTAVVYYASVQVRKNYEEKRRRTSIGLVETLVRTDAGWKFISLTSFAIGGED